MEVGVGVAELLGQAVQWRMVLRCHRQPDRPGQSAVRKGEDKSTEDM